MITIRENQHSWSETLSRAKLTQMRTVLMFSAKGTSQFRKEISSAVKSSRLTKASVSHVKSVNEIIQEQLRRKLHMVVDMLTGRP